MKLLTLAVSAALAMSVAGVSIAQNQGKSSNAGAKASAPYQAQTERGKAAGQIVIKWAGYVSKIYGTSPSAWSKAMAPTFAQADLRNMQRAARMTTFEGMMSALMGQRASDDQIINTMAKSDGSLPAIQALGSPSEDLVYTAIVPCRLFDTRLAGGAIQAGETRDFISSTDTDFTAQGGAASDCGIPAGASAVVMNVTTVRPQAGGFLTVFPFNSPRPLAASVNYIINADNGNELLVKQTMGQEFDFSVYAFSPVNVVGDAAGYFMAPQATSLDCVSAVGTIVSVGSGGVTPATADCPVGFTVTGGGNLRIGEGALNLQSSHATSDTQWKVEVNRSGGAAVSVQAQARCCRVPGR